MADFRASQLPKWESLINQIFNNEIPEHYEWTSLNDIVNVLNLISTSDTANHTFFPNSGGLDLCGAILSQEPLCIELNFDGIPHVIKPQKLIFESFAGADSEWFHFRIVTDKLQPSGIYSNTSLDYEELVELSPLYYADRAYWDSGEYNGEPLPTSARLISRIFDGDFVIFSKASLYNLNSSTYDARHNKLGEVGFRNHIIEVVKYLRENNN